MSDDDRTSAGTTCTCPPPPVDEEVIVPGHRHDCPVVADFQEIKRRVAEQEAKEFAQRGGGFLPTEGQREARQVATDLSVRMDGLEAALIELTRMVGAIADALIEDGWPGPNGSSEAEADQ